jgi:hypothetical protein
VKEQVKSIRCQPTDMNVIAHIGISRHFLTSVVFQFGAKSSTFHIHKHPTSYGVITNGPKRHW